MSFGYVVKIKESGERMIFTSMASIYIKFTYEDLHVSNPRLGRVLSAKGYYENNYITVDKIPLYKRKERIYKK